MDMVSRMDIEGQSAADAIAIAAEEEQKKFSTITTNKPPTSPALIAP